MRQTIDAGIRLWLLASAFVVVLAAAQFAVEWMNVRGQPLTETLVEVSQQRVSGVEYVRLLRRAADSSSPQASIRLRQAIDALERSRDRLATSTLGYSLPSDEASAIVAGKQRVLDALDRVLRYSQPGVVGTQLQPVPDALSDELLDAQEALLASIAGAINRAETTIATWRRSFQIATVLGLAFALWLGIGQANRHARAIRLAYQREQHSLTERNNLLLELYNESPIMLYSLDADARIVSVNDAWLNKMGFSRDEVLGRQTREFMSDESRGAINEATGGQPLHPDLLAYGSVTNLSINFVTRTGDTLYASVSARLIRNANGEAAGAHAIIVDVTEHTLALRDLEQTRARLFDTFATLPIPMFHVDMNGRFLRANLATKRLFGVDSVAALNALGHADIFTVAGHRLSISDTTAVHESRQTLIGASARELVVNLSLRIVKEGDDRFYEGVLIDVTQLEAARQSVAAGQERYRQLYDMTPVMNCSVNPDGRISTVSDYWLDRMGYHADEVLERRFDEFVAPDDRRSGERIAAAMRGQPATFRENASLITKTGDRLTGELHGARLRSGTGRLTGVIFSFLDRTAEIDAQRERDRMASDLATAHKLEAIGQLAAGIAHEINTPSQYVSDNLAFVTSALESLWPLLEAVSVEAPDTQRVARLAEESDLEFLREELPAALEQSRDGVVQITKIVKAMKEYSHPGDDELAPLDLNRALHTVATIARNEWKYVAKLDYDLDEDLPPLTCIGSAVTQVLLNVLVNAAHAIADAKACDPERNGRIVLASRATGDDLIVSISDNGIGIDPAIREDLFNPFFTTKEVGRGTGQGLSIAHRIVAEQHGGRIDIDSVPGKGTTFHLVFPRRAKEAEAGHAA